MRACVRLTLLLLGVGASAPAAAAAQATPGATAAAAALSPATKTLALQRFRVLVIRDGLVLTPRQGAGKTLEISNGAIAVDGTAVSGRELRDQLGADADVVIQLSYASPDALRAAFAPSPAPSEAPSQAPVAPPSQAPVAPPAPGTPAVPERDATPEPRESAESPEVPERPVPDREWKRKSGAKVNVGGSIRVDEDERVTDAVVAVG